MAAIIKARLDKALSNLVQGKMSLSMTGGLEQNYFKAPLNRKPCYDFVILLYTVIIPSLLKQANKVSVHKHLYSFPKITWPDAQKMLFCFKPSCHSQYEFSTAQHIRVTYLHAYCMKLCASNKKCFWEVYKVFQR